MSGNDLLFCEMRLPDTRLGPETIFCTRAFDGIFNDLYRITADGRLFGPVERVLCDLATSKPDSRRGGPPFQTAFSRGHPGKREWSRPRAVHRVRDCDGHGVTLTVASSKAETRFTFHMPTAPFASAACLSAGITLSDR